MSNFKKVNELEIDNIIAEINRLDEKMFEWTIDGRSVNKKEIVRLTRRAYNISNDVIIII